MAERQWTGPQRDAIDAVGGSVLVSAAAGSGKTAVLVERAIRLICDEADPVDADRLLIVTFSRAAAAEMKQRIGARLSELIRQRPQDVRLQRQRALLAGAQISTVDAFCLELVKQNFQHLPVSPDFGMIDEGELAVLKQECARECIEAGYEAEGEEQERFHQLVELLTGGRDDSRLVETVLKIHDFSRSHPFPEEWLQEKLALYDTDSSPGETVWGQALLRHALSGVEACFAAEADMLARMEGEAIQKAYGDAFRSDLWQLDRCREALDSGDWDVAVAAVAAYKPERLGALRGEDPLKDRAKAVRDQTKKMLGELRDKYLCATEADFREDLAALRPQIATLFALVGDFSRRLWEAMGEKRRLHFSDVQHLALALLAERRPDGTYGVTERAREVAAGFETVLVDEYQDTNEVQDMLFTCVSREQRNLFFVGDVKQSIYGFRQAMPEIFMAKKERFFPYDTGQYPAKINLDTNFRSRREVTEAVNHLFSLLMSREVGDVDYDEAESLKQGATYPPHAGAQPELLVVDAGDYKGSRGSDALEARAVGTRIRELLSAGYRVAEGGDLRPAALRDFCILMRSPRNRAATYIQELAKLGIAAVSENSGGFLAAREVSATVSLLRALDNPLLDVELVAAMLSPLLGFTADEIAAIRLAAKGQPFFTAVSAAAAGGDEKAERFLALFHRLRAQAAVLPADRLLLRLYEETEALSVYRAMAMGEGRRANLLMLCEYAATYHQMGYKQLGGFVGFLGRLQAREGDLRPASALGDGADAVRIMSIHRSKGLEFPVVFVSDTARQFNKVDLRQNTMLYSRYGFACVRRDYDTRAQYATVPLQAMRLAAQKDILSEEMRMLYVALTRAREKLIITGTMRANPGKKLAGLCHALDGGRLPPRLVGEMNCYLDWVLASLLQHRSCGGLREAAGIAEPALLDDGNPWRAVILSAAEAEPPAAGPPVAAPSAASAADPELLAQLRARAAWRYPYEGETLTPTKLAVSAAAKGELGSGFRFSARPKFLGRQGLSPTERGNAMHKFMQFADYEAARTDVKAEAARMEEEGFLSPAEAASLDAVRLGRFFRSALAGRIFKSKKVWRELKFMAECGQAMLGDTVEHLAGDAKIVLQGVADCVFEEDGAAVIVDYKTDRVRSGEELAERYAPQLRLYRAILGESLQMPVKECLLYSFALSAVVEVS